MKTKSSSHNSSQAFAQTNDQKSKALQENEILREKKLRMARMAARDYLKNRQDLHRLLEQAKRKVLEQGNRVSKVRLQLHLLLDMLHAWSRREYHGLSWRVVLTALTAVVYFLNPVDASPDFLPVVGYLDDILVISACLPMMRGSLKEFRNWNRLRRLQQWQRQKKKPSEALSA